jgi:hypothetical protein
MRPNPIQKPDFQWLAGPGKRHYTFARRPERTTIVGPAARCHRSLKALIFRTFVPKRSGNAPTGEVVARDVFAPFVYRLGRHPFTVERAVRFR